MATSDDGLFKRSRDDEQALRLAALAIGFSNTEAPLSSQEVRRRWYPDASLDTFTKSFSRDRARLEQCGIVLRSSGKSGDWQLWEVDRAASFASAPATGTPQAPGELSAEDAMALEVTLGPLASDPSFAQRSDLILALAKINRSFEMLVVEREGDAPRNARLETLGSALASRTPVRTTYQTASGDKGERTLALLGQFGLRGHTYFVADHFDEKSHALAGTPHTYRDDRFLKVKPLAGAKAAGAYQVDADFDARDWRVLPFQIGDASLEATFAVREHPTSEAARAVATRGTLSEDGRTWTVTVADEDAAARWAVDVDMAPLSPASLVRTWHQVLDAARSCTAEAPTRDVASALERAGRPSTAAHATGAGRPGGTTKARRLVALIGALSEQGDLVDAEVVAARLDCSLDEAREMLSMLSDASDTEGALRLPLVADDSFEHARLGFATTKGRPVRLTRDETLAVLAALSRVGATPDDEIVSRLITTLAAPSVSADEVTAALAASRTKPTPEERATLATCSQALADAADLRFAYTDAHGEKRLRTITPDHLYTEDGYWYLRGFDHTRGAGRTFRLDRMDAAESVSPELWPADDRTDTQPTNATPADAANADACIRIDDDGLLDLFAWPQAHVVRTRSATYVVAHDFGGVWLPRRLAACAGKVTVFDDALAARIRDHAESHFTMGTAQANQ